MPHKLGRNELCYCGSGKKYKKCCLNSSSGQRPVSAEPCVFDPRTVHTIYRKEYLRAFGKDFVPPNPTHEELRETAAHEAGHVVAYLALGFEVRFATAYPYFEDGRGWARGATDLKSKEIPVEKIRELVVAICAGVAGAPESNPDADVDQLERIFRCFSAPFNGKKVFEDHLPYAEIVLEKNKSAHQIVTDLLIAKQVVAGEEIRQAIHSVLRPVKFDGVNLLIAEVQAVPA
jgi:hypothetical protein